MCVYRLAMGFRLFALVRCNNRNITKGHYIGLLLGRAQSGTRKATVEGRSGMSETVFWRAGHSGSAHQGGRRPCRLLWTRLPRFELDHCEVEKEGQIQRGFWKGKLNSIYHALLFALFLNIILHPHSVHLMGSVRGGSVSLGVKFSPSSTSPTHLLDECRSAGRSLGEECNHTTGQALPSYPFASCLCRPVAPFSPTHHRTSMRPAG